MAEDMLKVQQVEIRLEEIVCTPSYYLDRTQDILEVLQGRMTWLETTKDLETVNMEYELIELGSKAAEELVKVVRKTKSVCAEFYIKVLITYNHCQTSAKRRLEELPDHEGFLSNCRKYGKRMNKVFSWSKDWMRRC